MKVIGWIGLLLIVIGVVLITFGGTVWASKNDKENTWHFVSIAGGAILAIIGVVMVIVGSRGSASPPKGYENLLVPKIFAANIKYDIDNYHNGGDKPCFARKPEKSGPWSFIGK